MSGLASLLVLADGRFPSGGHAHSGGLEAAVAAGGVHSLDDLARFLEGRLWTSGLVAAALTAASRVRAGEASTTDWLTLDAEADARTPSPALRVASRRQGRQLLRAARVAWPHPVLDSLAPTSPHHPVVLGAAASAAGLSATAAATASASASVSTPATAAVRLLGLDPLAVAGLLASLAPQVDSVARAAIAAAAGPLRHLPALSAPLLDVGAEAHASWEVRLFAS